MWYVLYSNPQKRNWYSFERPESAMSLISQLIRDGQAECNIIILNATNPDNILSVEEFRAAAF